MRQPLPSTCRDTVTGNAFFHGCVDELTWLLEDKSGWVAGLAMTLALIKVCTMIFMVKHPTYIYIYIISTFDYFWGKKITSNAE